MEIFNMKTEIRLEIRAAEGGNDSKLLVEDLTNIYVKSCRNQDFECEIQMRDGFASL